MEYIERQTYENAILRLEELIYVITDETPDNHPLAIEFINITNTIQNYKSKHFSVIT